MSLRDTIRLHILKFRAAYLLARARRHAHDGTARLLHDLHDHT